ncbi:MAG: hypothetical protein ACFFDN_45995 [Candidatus Hodarchaeota archaeon]
MTEYTVIDFLKDISNDELEKEILDLLYSNMDENEVLEKILKQMVGIENA